MQVPITTYIAASFSQHWVSLATPGPRNDASPQIKSGACVAGFVKGVGQGILGVAAQPASGVLDLVSSAFEGLDATSSSLIGRQRARNTTRARLPRAIGGDRKLQPFIRSDGTDSQARCNCMHYLALPCSWK